MQQKQKRPPAVSEAPSNEYRPRRPAPSGFFFARPRKEKASEFLFALIIAHLFCFVKGFGAMLTNKRSFLYIAFIVGNGLLMFIYRGGRGLRSRTWLLCFTFRRGKFVRSRTWLLCFTFRRGRGGSLYVAARDFLALPSAKRCVVEGQRAQALALYPPTPTISRSLRLTAPSAPSRTSRACGALAHRRGF